LIFKDEKLRNDIENILKITRILDKIIESEQYKKKII